MKNRLTKSRYYLLKCEPSVKSVKKPISVDRGERYGWWQEWMQFVEPHPELQELRQVLKIGCVRERT